MNCKLIILAVLCLLPSVLFAQATEIINPKDKWYFGAEIGPNIVGSYSLGESNKSFQGGILAEYYFARHWSVAGLIKYYQTGVSFYRPDTHTGSWFDLGSDEYYGKFDGAVLTLPVAIKWEFRVYRNLAASMKLGAAFNYEVKSNYGLYTESAKTDYPRSYLSFNAGYGVNYFINKNFAAFLDVESFIGQSKGSYGTLLGPNYYNTENVLINFGVKYTFDKVKENIENPAELDQSE